MYMSRLPLTVTFPVLCGNSFSNDMSKVDFPEPTGPMTAISCPGFKLKLMFLSVGSESCSHRAVSRSTVTKGLALRATSMALSV